MRLFASVLIASFAMFAIAVPGAFAQSSSWDKPADLKPLLPPIITPVLPPNSQLNAGGVGGTGPSSTYSGPPIYDSTQNLPAPGLRLTVPMGR